MTPMTVKKLTDIVHGKLLCGSDLHEVVGISIDSRTVRENDLFVAIVGGKVDGHDFLPDVFAKGASAALVTRPVAGLSPNATQVQVEDPIDAISKLAIHERSSFAGPVIGLTGSNGKTTTKEMLAIIFASQSSCLYTKGNFNNEIGLPLSILQRTPAHGSMVLEMGMRGKGQITHLCTIAKPTAGLITNIGQSHIELLGSQEEIANAKSELLTSLPQGGPTVLWGEDPWLKKIAQRAPGPVYWYGQAHENHAYATDIARTEHGTTFTAQIFGKSIEVFIPTFGIHNVNNALGAMLMGALHDIPLQSMADALAQLQPTTGRLNITQGTYGRQIIDDCYNASPLSVKASLDVLRTVSQGKSSVAILGDMYELGDFEVSGHEQVATDVVETGVGTLIAVGPKSLTTANHATSLGHPRVQYYESKAQLLDELAQVVPKNSVILVKASRGMKLEEVVEALRTLD